MAVSCPCWRAAREYGSGACFSLLQVDELYARVRQKGVPWLLGALDPVTTVIPTLQLGPPTTEAAMQLVHQVTQVLAPGCVPAFTTDGLRAYFYALTAHFGQWSCEAGQRQAHWQVSDELLHGQLVKCEGRHSLRACGWHGECRRRCQACSKRRGSRC